MRLLVEKRGKRVSTRKAFGKIEMRLEQLKL